MLVLDARETADARAHEHADVRRVGFGNRQLRIINRELRGGYRVLNEDVHLLDIFFPDELQRIELPHLARNLRRESRMDRNG